MPRALHSSLFTLLRLLFLNSCDVVDQRVDACLCPGLAGSAEFLSRLLKIHAPEWHIEAFVRRGNLAPVDCVLDLPIGKHATVAGLNFGQVFGFYPGNNLEFGAVALACSRMARGAMLHEVGLAVRNH